MHSRGFAVAAVAALALAGYAMWMTLRRPAAPPVTEPSAPTRPAKAKSKRAAGTAPRPTPSPVRPPPKPYPPRRPAVPVDPDDGAAGDGDDRQAPNKAPFDYPMERFDLAVKMLREGEADGPNRTALLQQAALAIKDMNALLDPDIPTQKRDLTRATETLARLEAGDGS